MAFSFSFSGDDIDEDTDPTAAAEQDDLARQMGQHDISTSGSITTPLLKPRKHSLVELLSSLPSQVSYNSLAIPPPLSDTFNHALNQNPTASLSSPLQIPRRSHFDIVAQLMAEADLNPESNASSAQDALVTGLRSGDLSRGIYEGGFKTWECAVDLAEFLMGIPSLDFATGSWHVIELGAGSAVPSLLLLQMYLRMQRQTDIGSRSIQFTLCDYNEDVLRLATAVNVFLTLQLLPNSNSTIVNTPVHNNGDNDYDIDLEAIGSAEEIAQHSANQLTAQGVSVDFISGAWGEEFIRLVQNSPPPPPSSSSSPPPLSAPNPTAKNILILASETIYSPTTTSLFADTVISLLKPSSSSSSSPPPKSHVRRAYIAAKRIYFGVGGGVEDFCTEIVRRGGVVRGVAEAGRDGVGRVVLEVTIAAAAASSAEIMTGID